MPVCVNGSALIFRLAHDDLSAHLQAAPAFGSASFGASLPKAASTPVFGATPSSTPGLFGTSSSTNNLFSFPAATQPAQTSMFGALPPAPAATPAFSGLSFGALQQQPQQQQQAGATPGQPLGMQVVPMASGPGVPTSDLSDAVRAVDSIAAAYNPANPRYRFQRLLLNVVEVPAARAKPANADELQWREALQRAGGVDNPDHLWPVQAQGFKDLLARKAAQDEACKEQAARLEALKHTASMVASRQEALINEQLESIRRRQVQLCEQLLHLLRHVDALEGRLAQAMGVRGATPRELLDQLSRQLNELESEIMPTRLAGGLYTKVEALAAAAQLQARGAGPQASQVAELDGIEAGTDVFAVLSGYAETLAKLQAVMQRAEGTLQVLST